MRHVFRYKNHKGEVKERSVVPQRLYFGTTEFYPEPQWLLVCLDLEKDAVRTFSLASIVDPENLNIETHAPSARKKAFKQAAEIAAMFTMKPDRRIHPDIAWDDMNESSKTAAHTTAQQIAWAIWDRGKRP